MEDKNRQPVCRDIGYETHFTPERTEALKKWRGQGENAPLTSGMLFTSDYLSDDEVGVWSRKQGTSKP